MSIEKDRLMGRMGSVPILFVKWSVSIGKMVNFDRDGNGDGDGTCKQTLKVCLHVTDFSPFNAAPFNSPFYY